MLTLNTWEAVMKDNLWQVQTEDGRIIATIGKGKNSESNAKLIAISPYMLEALKAVVNIIGDEDLPDNGEFSGSAVSDLVRSAITLAESNKE